MKKTAFKTFVCSFVFSLFILFTINGLFLHTPEIPSQDIKIPSKNISLFFTGAADNARAAHIRPIKKIALSIPQKEKKATIETVYAPASQPTPSPAAPQVDTHQKEPIQDNVPIFDEIPLEIAQEDVLPQKTELVSADFERIMNTPPSVYEATENSSQNIIPLTKADEDVSEVNTSSVSEIAPKQTPAAKEDAKTEHLPQPLIVASTENSKPLQLASRETTLEAKQDTPQNNTEAPKQKDIEQQLLIPLQKDHNMPDTPTFAVAKAAEPNQIAMVNNSAPLNSLLTSEEKAPNKAETNNSSPKEWKEMSEISGSDSPWVAAKGTKFPKNNKILESEYYKDADKVTLEAKGNSSSAGDEVKVAAEMVQNILIPIPEDILKEDNLVPQLESSAKGSKEKEEEEKAKQEKIAEDASSPQKNSDKPADKADEQKNKESKGGLLKSITSLFSSTTSQSENSDDKEEQASVEEHSNSFVDRITGRIRKSSNKPTKILPAEMRLAFQPNRAEISGTTLKWIHAFANKVNSDRSVILEIRIDGTSSYALQQKRLNLLHNILTNKGVDYRKINTVFTTREPNSFIIRTVRINSNIDRNPKENSDQAAYYQAW